MKGTLVDIIMEQITRASRLRHRLVVVAAPYGTGKSHALHAIAARTGAPLLNPDLSDHVRSPTAVQRQKESSRFLARIVGGAQGDLVLVDRGDTLSAPGRTPDFLDSLWEAVQGKTVVIALHRAEGQSKVLLWKRQGTRRTRRQH